MRERENEQNEIFGEHLALAAHVVHKHSARTRELRQHTYRSFAFGCFVLFLTLLQTLHVWEGEVLPANPLTRSVSPHPERTLLKVVGAHEQTVVLQWAFGFEFGLLLLCWLLGWVSRRDGPLTTMKIQFLLLLSGCCVVFHIGALGVRMYALWIVHFSWAGGLAAFLDFLWLALNCSTFFTLVYLLHDKEHAQHLINTNPTKKIRRH